MKLVVVSHRLPAAVREEDGRIQITPGPGGLTSALHAHLASPLNPFVNSSPPAARRALMR